MQITGMTLATLYVESYFNETKLSSGTAFLYKYKDTGRYYIITNWHVVSGKNNQTNKCLDKNLSIPNKLKVFFYTKDSFTSWIIGTVNLYDEMECLVDKIWLEHPTYDKNVDVVALPIPDEMFNTVANYNITDELEYLDYKQDYKPTVGDELFILGYPKGIKAGGYYPIWKSGIIASEPDFNMEELPLFYIDAATREGMSGSAVIVKRPRPITITNGTKKSNFQTSLVGIYSGRIADDSFGLQIGRVWKSKVIDEIILGNIP